MAPGPVLLVLLAVAVSIVAVAQPRQHAAVAACPAADPDLRAVLDLSAPAVREACTGKEAFATAIRAELRRSFEASRPQWRRGVEQADTDAALAEWRQDRLVSLPGGARWSVPQDPTWQEDPYRNLSWAAGYQSLGWLGALARGYREGDRSLGAELKRYLLSWIGANPVDEPPSPRSWYDGAVHRRTNTIVSMLDVLLDELTDSELTRVLISLHEHGALLDSYLGMKRFVGHNHNLFHALALTNLARNVPVLADASSWERDARGRMQSLLREMVDPRDGVSTEQASSYHYVAMRLFRAAQQYLASDGAGLGDEDLALVTEMTRFGALVLEPGGTLPAIGDTAVGTDDARAMALLAQYAEMDLITPEAEYVLTRGAGGQRPADAAFFAGQGYAIFRPSYGEVGRWEDDLHVVVDIGPERRVHGHHDALNVLLAAYGEQLLIDSGGPYQYGVEARLAFIDAAAHNTVTVDRIGDAAGDASMERAIDRATYSLVVGSHEAAPGVGHRRSVLVVKPWLVLVVDELSASDGQLRRYDLLYHLPPSAEVQAQGSAALATIGEAAVGVAVDAGEELSLSVRSGVRHGASDPLLGWVTTANGKRDPAPVLDVSQRASSAWYVTAILPSPAARAVQPEVTAQRTASGMLIEVEADGERWTVVLPEVGEPSVE